MATPALPSAAQQSPSKFTAVGQEDKEKNNTFFLKMRIACLNLYNHHQYLSYIQSLRNIPSFSDRKKVGLWLQNLNSYGHNHFLICVSLQGLESLHDKADAPAECTSHGFHQHGTWEWHTEFDYNLCVKTQEGSGKKISLYFLWVYILIYFISE